MHNPRRPLVALSCLLLALCAASIAGAQAVAHFTMSLPVPESGTSSSGLPTFSNGATATTTWVQGLQYQPGQVIGVNGMLCADLKISNTADPATDTTGTWLCSAAPVTFQHNGTANGVQNKLNLVQGQNVSIADDGAGNLTIASTAPGGSVSGFTNASNSLTTAVSACGSSATTLQITQAITIGASLTVPTNCTLWFQSGGELLPSSGVTLTINGTIQAPQTQQIFGGSGTVALGTATREIPAAWFGALNDGATDNKAALQAAANAAYAGTDIRLNMGTYLISSALSLPTGVGINGATFANDTPPLTKLLSTSASADIIDIGANTNNCRVTNMLVGRTVLPNAGTHGIAVVGISGGYMLSNLWVADSYSDVYYNHAPTGYHGTIGVSAVWGQNGVSGYPNGAALTGFELDSENSQPADSQVMEFVGAGDTPAGTTTTAIYVHGQTIQDLNIRNVNSGPTSHGLVITYDGTDSFDSAYDIHINHPTFDNCSIDCVEINNLPSIGSVVIDDLYVTGNSSSSAAVVLNNSQGVTINGAEIANLSSGGGMTINGGSNNSLSAAIFNFQAGGNGLTVLNSNHNILENLTFIGTQSTPMADMIGLGGTSAYNLLGNIHGDGWANTGFYAATTAGPNQLENVDFAHGSNITTPVVDQFQGNYDLATFFAHANGGFYDFSFNGNHANGTRLGCAGDTAGVNKNLYCDVPSGGFFIGRVNNVTKFSYGGSVAPTAGSACTSAGQWGLTDDATISFCSPSSMTWIASTMPFSAGSSLSAPSGGFITGSVGGVTKFAYGGTVAPTAGTSCSNAGQWGFTDDGHVSFCTPGALTWATKI